MSVRPAPLLLLAVAVAGGVVGGLTVYGVTRAERTTPNAAPSSDGTHDLDTRMSALERTLAEFSRHAAVGSNLRALQEASRAPQAPAGPTAGAPSAAGPSAVVDDPVFEAAVRDVVDRVREERDNERQLQRDEQRRTAAQRWASELGAKLGLRDDQRTALEALAQKFYEQLRERFRGGDAGMPAEHVTRRDAVRALRDEYDAKLRDVLNPDQMRDYEKLDDDFKLGARHRDRARQ